MRPEQKPPMIRQRIFILVMHDKRLDLGLSAHLTREGADAVRGAGHPRRSSVLRSRI